MNQENKSRIRLLLVTPIFMWILVLAGIILAFHFLPAYRLFGRNVVTILLFLAVAVNWIYFFFGAISMNRSAARSAAAIRSLATTGVYGKVRHPIYSADILLAWGVFLLFPTLRMLVSMLWLTVVLFFWMKLEESALEQKFGEEYRTYKSRTPMAIPRIFHKT